MTQRIAIIGTGISGLTCAHLLHKDHEITLYEANNYIGGHTATKQVTVQGKEYDIDTGFIVFNDWTYPNFIALMDKLGVQKQATEMSFSVFSPLANLEYNGHDLNTLFAQRRNILRPRFWRIVSDIVRFNKVCKQAIAESKQLDDMTLGQFIDTNNFSDDFAQFYILPMCAAIWSASIEQTKAFPLQFFLQFFNNHGLLNITNRPQWYTLVGGSHSYIKPMIAGFEQHIKLSSPIERVTKTTNGEYEVVTKQGSAAKFDEVIFACHSDQALAMIDTPTDAQRQVLGSIPYAENDVVLHTDVSQLPKRSLAWASWNYLIKDDHDAQLKPASVTYNMNILQCLEAPETFCVTLNNTAALNPDKILGSYQYAHPQFSTEMVAAQHRRAEVCGVDGLHFCGAYWYNGFHEDGVRSALDVCQRFGVSL